MPYLIAGFIACLIILAVLASNRMSAEAYGHKVSKATIPSGSLGPAQLGTTDTLKGDGGILLGYDKVTGEQLRHLPRDGHGMVFGPTGSGKDRDWCVPAILDLAGRCSLVLIDPKASKTAMCHHYWASKGPLHVLNPFDGDAEIFPANMKLPKSARYNPMAGLDPTKPGFTLKAERLANSFASDNRTHSNETSAYFRDRAIQTIAGVIMHICDLYPPELRTLSTLRNVITSANGANFWVFVQDARDRGTPYVQQKLARFAERDARESKEVADVLSTATRYTDFIGNETIAQSLEGHDFDFYSLKDEPGTVSVILPMEHMHTCGKWLSVIVASAIHELWRKGRGKVPVVIVLDEMAQYGAIDILIAAMNAARNFGIVLVCMVQQLSDLEVMYGKQANSFINGASWKIFYASDDLATRGLVEKLGGMKTVKVPHISFSEGKSGISSTVAYGEHAVPLKSGFDVGMIPPDEFLLKVAGLPLIEAKRKPYWEQDLNGKWSPDPYEESHDGA